MNKFKSIKANEMNITETDREKQTTDKQKKTRNNLPWYAKLCTGVYYI